MISMSYQTYIHLLKHVETELQMWCLYALDSHLLANKPKISSHCPFLIACIKKETKLNWITLWKHLPHIHTMYVHYTECMDDAVPAFQMIKM